MYTLIHCKHEKQFELFHSENDSTFLTIPDALLERNRDQLFLTWQMLERQLSQVDPKKEPEMYLAINSRASIVFDAWLRFRYVGRCC